MRLTKNGKPFEPKPGNPGSSLTFNHEGREITGEVWGDADKFGQSRRTVWIISDGVAYAVTSKGRVVSMRDYRRSVVAA
jgi:hypothetical protein